MTERVRISCAAVTPRINGARGGALTRNLWPARRFRQRHTRDFRSPVTNGDGRLSYACMIRINHIRLRPLNEHEASRAIGYRCLAASATDPRLFFISHLSESLRVVFYFHRMFPTLFNTRSTTRLADQSYYVLRFPSLALENCSFGYPFFRVRTFAFSIALSGLLTSRMPL